MKLFYVFTEGFQNLTESLFSYSISFHLGLKGTSEVIWALHCPKSGS